MVFLTVVAIVSGLIAIMCLRIYIDKDPVLPAPSHLSYIGQAWYYLSHKGCFKAWLGIQVIMHIFSILVAIDERSCNIFSNTPETNDPTTKAFWKAKLDFCAFAYVATAVAIAGIACSQHKSDSTLSELEKGELGSERGKY
ncbi:hypothetical protein ACHAQI_009806 [Fusarium lateritium]